MARGGERPLKATDQAGNRCRGYGYHDFGMVEVDPGTGNLRLYWKIDLYDRALEYGSPEPTDPDKTHRVLTILFPSEY